MPDIPAYCNDCGAIFSSGQFLDGSELFAFERQEVGPCPICGGQGHIPDGIYRLVGGRLERTRLPAEAR